ncbi:neurotensin receptor type 1 isoform X1 [Tupaia chinensis]|uniref:neurotensin receptor type 1 isoform X1 n=1 Tax=Tupaia chinensis TaxID=246437 RepID=UPI0003C8EE67|nr:neurotensin receptor type 1 isoform X1 [Tupaia chinensis]
MRVNSSVPGANPFPRPRSGLEAALLATALRNDSANQSGPVFAAPSSDLDVNTDIYSKGLVTAVYLVLFVVGTVGNSVTACTLARKKSLQGLQGTVHYHLGSLALSDLLTLLLAMPVELYNFIWVHHPWAFGDAVCRGYYFLRDACTYATALNVASLSVERYLAICHPFKAKTLMSRSRTKKFIGTIWLASGLLATPMLFTMGQQNRSADGQHPGGLVCTPIVHAATIKAVIQVNTFVSFVFPMVVISVLNTIIANKLTVMVRHAAEQGQALWSWLSWCAGCPTTCAVSCSATSRRSSGPPSSTTSTTTSTCSPTCSSTSAPPPTPSCTTWSPPTSARASCPRWPASAPGGGAGGGGRPSPGSPPACPATTPSPAMPPGRRCTRARRAGRPRAQGSPAQQRPAWALALGSLCRPERPSLPSPSPPAHAPHPVPPL